MRSRAETPRESFVALQLLNRSKRGECRPPRGHQPLAKLPDGADADRVEFLFDFVDRNYPAIRKEMGRDLLGARRGTLEAHEQTGSELSLGACDLLGIRRLRQQGDLFDNQPGNLLGLVLARAGINANHAAIDERVRESINRIAETTSFANLLKEAGRHPAAERRCEDLRGEKRIIATGNTRKSPGDMYLLEFFPVPYVAADELRRHAFRCVAEKQIAKMAYGELNHGSVIDRAGRNQRHAAGAIIRIHVLIEMGAREGTDGPLIAQNRPTHRLVRIDRLLQVVKNDVVRRVVRLSDLLQHDVALAFELSGIESRVRENVGENVYRQRNVRLQHTGMKGRLFPARIGVERAA